MKAASSSKNSPFPALYQQRKGAGRNGQFLDDLIHRIIRKFL